MKVNDVTPLRARRMFNAIKNKYMFHEIDMKTEWQLRAIGSRIKDEFLYGFCCVICINKV